MRKIILSGYLNLLFSLALVGPAYSLSENKNADGQAETQLDSKRMQRRLTVLEVTLEEARYAKDIAEIRADLIESQTGWFEILIGVLIAFFGMIVAGSTIFFTFRFGNAAVTAARAEIVLQKAAIDSQLQEAKRLLSESKAIVEQIQQHEEQAKDIVAGLQPGEVPTDAHDRETINDIAKKARPKSARNRTLDEYRALVINSMIDEDWKTVEQHSSAMIHLFGDTDLEAAAFAMFYKAYSLHKLGRSDEAISIYGELVSRFRNSKTTYLHDLVSVSLYNMACIYASTNNVEATIVALKSWHIETGSFDCASIAYDSDFDAIRNDPAFVAFLTTNGCPPSPEPSNEA